MRISKSWQNKVNKSQFTTEKKGHALTCIYFIYLMSIPWFSSKLSEGLKLSEKCEGCENNFKIFREDMW